MAKKRSKKWSKPKKEKKVKTSGDYFVEEIVDWALDKSGKLMYLLKWEDYSQEDNSWEFDEHVFDCDDIKDQFMDSLNGRHPPKNSWEEFDNFVEYLKQIIDFNYKDCAVLTKLSQKKRTFVELKSDKIIEEIKLKIECEFSKLLINKFEKRTNSERLIANELVGKVSKNLKIDKNFGTITQFFEFIDKRKSFAKELKVWENKQNKVITKEKEGLPITIVNDVDLEIPQLEKYITKYIIDAKVEPNIKQIEEETPVHSCECENCYNERHDCCTAVIGFPMAYNNKGLLSSSRFSTIIFECNKLCKCSDDCVNRAVQRGRQSKLEIFRTEYGERGWGVRTLEPIPKGAFITQYVGEIISLQEADNRPTTYLFDLSTSLDSSDYEYTYVVDANRYGNVGRFINHSCDPNCRIIFVWINNYDKLLPFLAIFSTKPIRANEELTYDYSMEVIDVYDQIQSTSKSDTINEDNGSTDSGIGGYNIEKATTSHDININIDNSSSDHESDRKDDFNRNSLRRKKVPFKEVECKCNAKNCRKILYS